MLKNHSYENSFSFVNTHFLVEPISFGFFHSNKHFGEIFPYKLKYQITMYNYAGLKNPAGPQPKEATDRELPKGPMQLVNRDPLRPVLAQVEGEGPVH